MRGDNLPIVDLSKYNTDGKEAKYIQINYIVEKLTSNKKITEKHMKKAEVEFTMDKKTLIAKTALDPEPTRVRNSMRREDRETIPDSYRTVFEKLLIIWGLVFLDDQIVVPIDLRRRLLDIIHFGHSGITKMISEARRRNLFYFVGKNYNKKSLEGNFQNKIQTAVSGTKSTTKTDTGKLINRKFISGPLFQTKRKSRKEPAPNAIRETNPKNRHPLRGLDGKYGRWDEILRDILNGKLKNVQNKKRAVSDTDDDDDDEDDEEMPKETGTPSVHDTFEKDRRYVPIRTNLEEDALQLHTDSEITGENLKTQVRRTNRESKKPNRYGSISYTGNIWE